MERKLRQFHGILGVVLSVFILVQVGSGTFLALFGVLTDQAHTHGIHSHDAPHESAEDHHGPNAEPTALQTIHHHGERPIQAMRAVLGIGIVLMVLSGTTIYVGVLKRRRKVSNQAL